MPTEAKGIQTLTARQKAKQKTQTKIIGAAQEAFHRTGYDAVTMRDLAKAIGMSTGALFSNYKSKAALFEAAMGEPAPDVEAFLTRLAAAVATPEHAEAALYEFAVEAERLRRHLRGNHA